MNSPAQSPLESHCTAIARSMVGRWGMSNRIGPVSVLPSEGDPRMFGVSAEALGAVDAEVSRVIDECNQEALSLLTHNGDRLEAIAAALLEHETLDEADVYAAAGIATGPATKTEDSPRTAISTHAQNGRGDMREAFQNESKDSGNGLEKDYRSPHEAGSGCTPAGADRLHVGGAAISDHGERNTDTERKGR